MYSFSLVPLILAGMKSTHANAAGPLFRIMGCTYKLNSQKLDKLNATPMNSKISKRVWDVLVCPDCKTKLSKTDQGASCDRCSLNYQKTRTGGLDCRLQKRITREYGFKLGDPLDVNSNVSKLQTNVQPDVDFSDIEIPYHLTKELMSYFPKASSGDSLMLDLGCGGMTHKKVCEHAGFEYVGLDYGVHAPVCGDAHALPFPDETFEFILSIAVLEHIRFPFVAMKEACRVLKPNGIFIGTVAFLEPFHADSYYHHTHLGIINTLQQGGFKVDKIAPSEEWSVLKAQASMGLFPGMPETVANVIINPVYYLHKLWWKYFRDGATENERIRDTTGAFTFIARKDNSQDY